MGAHHAPAHVARHARPAHDPSATPGGGWGRLAGRGVLTASAALALTGAGAGAALAQDSGTAGSLLASDSSLLCGILGGDRCSSDTESSADSSDGRSDTTSASDEPSRSVFDRFDDTSTPSRESAGDPGDDRASSGPQTRDEAPATAPSSTGTERQQASDLDTPPPPGQVRAINLPN